MDGEAIHQDLFGHFHSVLRGNSFWTWALQPVERLRRDRTILAKGASFMYKIYIFYALIDGNLFPLQPKARILIFDPL